MEEHFNDRHGAKKINFESNDLEYARNYSGSNTRAPGIILQKTTNPDKSNVNDDIEVNITPTPKPNFPTSEPILDRPVRKRNPPKRHLVGEENNYKYLDI